MIQLSLTFIVGAAFAVAEIVVIILSVKVIMDTKELERFVEKREKYERKS